MTMKNVIIPILATCMFATIHAAGCTSSSEPSERPYFALMQTGKLPAIVNEASGLIASRMQKGVLWTLNDSGDEARIFAIDDKGKLLSEVKLGNATNRDWEDIAIGPGPTKGRSYLYVGEIGDNEAKAPSIIVYRLEEPTITATAMTARADKLEFVYPDGARDAETLLSDPITGDLYVISKRERRNRIYRAAYPQRTGVVDTLEFIGELPFYLAVAGDVSPDGREVLVKNYINVFYWKRDIERGESFRAMFARQPDTLEYMPETQGESITWSADGSGYYTVSEQTDSTWTPRIYFYSRTGSKADVDKLRDVRRPSMSVTMDADTANYFHIRYTIPEQQHVMLYVTNPFGWRLIEIENDAAESGLVERTLDMRNKPPGNYVVRLFTSTFEVSVPFDVR